MAEPFIGEIKMVGFNFAPRGFATCDGQLLPISQNTALFSLLGTIYGGDGRTTFALPDLRSRMPMSEGNGPGLTPRRHGQRLGASTHTLTLAQLPSHNHPLTPDTTMRVATEDEAATSDAPSGKVLATGENIYVGGPGDGMLQGGVSGTSGSTGGGQSHENQQPYLTINFVIALTGTYPSRN